MSLESSSKNGSKNSSSSGNPGGSTSSSSLYPSANSIYSTPGKLLSVNPEWGSTSSSFLYPSANSIYSTPGKLLSGTLLAGMAVALIKDLIYYDLICLQPAFI
jgi:hypothetical protein